MRVVIAAAVAAVVMTASSFAQECTDGAKRYEATAELARATADALTPYYSPSLFPRVARESAEAFFAQREVLLPLLKTLAETAEDLAYGIRVDCRE